MLIMYVMDHPSKWEDYIHLIEFVYNNEYQASLKMSPFEAFYERKCNTPVSRDNLVERYHWTIFISGNGREDDKYQEEFKGYPGQEEELWRQEQSF
jgi:hypothetical protein